MNTQDFANALHNAKRNTIYRQFEDKQEGTLSVEKGIDEDNLMDVMRNQKKYNSFAVASHFSVDKSKDITLPEEAFQKAVEEMELEVFTKNDLNNFKLGVMRAAVNDKITSADIEKAKRDVAGLTKVMVTDKNGDTRAVWVRANKDAPKSEKKPKSDKDDESDKKSTSVSSNDSAKDTRETFDSVSKKYPDLKEKIDSLKEKLLGGKRQYSASELTNALSKVSSLVKEHKEKQDKEKKESSKENEGKSKPSGKDDKESSKSSSLPKNVEKFFTKFPDDATSWAKATDEIRDLAKFAREFINEIDYDLTDEEVENGKGVQPLDFKKLKTPSEWNTKGKEFIRKIYGKMSNGCKEKFLDKFKTFE